MNWIQILSVLLVLSLCRADDEIQKLKDSNFESTIKANPIVLVKFVASGCSNCKALKPEFKKLYTMLKERKINCLLGSITATSQGHTFETYRIQNFPTIMIFLNGTPTTYKGERNAEAIMRFIGKMTGPSSTELNADELKARKAETGRRVTFWLTK